MTKGNTFSFLIIDSNFQIKGIDAQQNATTLSEEGFAMDIGISEDGTIWAISTSPDPDGGGARIYWGIGDKNWNEIATSDPGGVRISGGTGSSCFYLTSDGVIRTLDTNGSSSVFSDTHDYLFFDYGGGMIWAVFSPPGQGKPQLHYSSADTLSWKAFAGDPSPVSISVNYDGNCFGIDVNSSPIIYQKDGQNTSSPGPGVNNNSMEISAKNWTYVISFSSDEEGNIIYVWEDVQGGKFVASSVRGNKVLATYYRA